MRKYAFFLAAVLAVACVEDNLETTVPVEESSVFTLTAAAPEAAGDTKTQISDDLVVTWSGEDQIKVCFPVNFSLYNQTTSQVRGTSAVFTTSSEDGASRAVFSCDSWDVDLDEVASGSNKYNDVGYAFYPASVEFSHTVASYSDGKSGTLTCTYTIPSVQNAVEGSFDKNLNPAYAPVDRGELLAGTSTVAFRNLAALVRISLSENIDNVKEIRISSTNASMGAVCGTMKLNISKDNEAPNIVTNLADAFSTTPVVLKKADNTNLQAGQTYYAVIVPGPTHKGLKLTFVHENTAVVEKVVSVNWNAVASSCWTINVKNPLDFPEAVILGVDTESFEPSPAGESTTVNVTAGDSWTVSSNSDWLTVSPAGGSGDGSFTMTAAENNSLSAREAIVTVASGDRTSTIRVYQNLKLYYIAGQITEAAQMENGAMYAINFQGSSYYWQVANNGVVVRATKSNTSNGFNLNQVFKFEKTNYSNPNSAYNSFATGFLYSPFVNQYFDYWSLSFKDDYKCDLVFLNRYGTETNADIDLIQYYDTVNGYVYWNTSSSSLAFGGSGNSNRKLYIYKVELR